MNKTAAVKRWLAGGLVIAVAGFPSAALAKYGPDVAGAPTGTPGCVLLERVSHGDARNCGSPRHRPRHAHRHTGQRLRS